MSTPGQPSPAEPGPGGVEMATNPAMDPTNPATAHDAPPTQTADNQSAPNGGARTGPNHADGETPVEAPAGSDNPKDAKAQAEAQGSEIAKASIDDVLERLGTKREGLSDQEVQERLAQYGKNQIEEKHVPAIIQFLLFLWNPLSWVMELAIILALILQDWADAVLVALLLLLNATIGFWEEHTSGEAIAALKANLAPTARVKRNGQYQNISAFDLVPGDVVRLSIGVVIPADCKLLEGDELKVDQASLTGESLPVTKRAGDTVYSGASVKQGQIDAVVYATGINTFFGKAANLVQSTETHGHFQKVLTHIGFFCVGLIAIFVVAEIIVEFAIRREPCPSPGKCPALTNTLVLIVGGVPIAMPTVMSVTMAIGAQRLAKQQALVARLTAVEELAGMDILCSDKTGTLTLNELQIKEPEPLIEGVTKEQLLLDAAIAAQRVSEDAIDKCVTEALTEEERATLDHYEMIKFQPFDPVSKRVIAKVKDPKSGKVFAVSKGAPQIILQMSSNKSQIEKEVMARIEDLGSRGYRTLGVARADDANCSQWVMEGLIPLFDPPRHDTAETIKETQHLGISVKMLTGDQTAIAKETCRQIELGSNIQHPDELHDYEQLPATEQARLAKVIEEADGFAGVFPEHKYTIVKALQRRRHFVGMTGDGVNDAPALKVADIGIAVAGATDAARAAADIVLQSPGLGVIVHAIIGARKIFQRMRNYAIYAVTTTVRIVLTFAVLTFGWNWFFPTFLIALIAILNDGTILTISKDRVQPSPQPDHWELAKIYFTAVCLGLYLFASSILLFVLSKNVDAWHHMFEWTSLKNNDNKLRALMYMHLSISGQAVIFSTRSVRWWWSSRPSWLLLIAFVAAQAASTCIGIFGFPNFVFTDRARFVGAGGWYALLAWIYSAIWFIPIDLVKFGANHLIDIIWPAIARLKAKRARRGEKPTEAPTIEAPAPPEIPEEDIPSTERRQRRTFGHPVYGTHGIRRRTGMIGTYTEPPDMATVHSIHEMDPGFAATLQDVTYSQSAGGTIYQKPRALKDIVWTTDTATDGGATSASAGGQMPVEGQTQQNEERKPRHSL